MPIAIDLEIFEPEQCHECSPSPQASSKVFFCSQQLSSGNKLKARSRACTSHSFLRSMRLGPGIRPSLTSSSNLLADIPMYIAASSRERPRRAIGRTAEGEVERAMSLNRVAIRAYAGFLEQTIPASWRFGCGDE